MSFANFNILPGVLSLIPKTPVQYRLANETKVNQYGQVESGYGEWIDAVGIVQPATKSNTPVEGIDLTKTSVQAWICDADLHTTDEGHKTPDQIRYCGRIYNVIVVTDWLAYDNFKSYTCQEASNLG